MPTPHLVFVTRGLHDGGGIERVTSFIASALAERGYHISVVCLQNGGTPHFPLSEKVALHYTKSSFYWAKVQELRAIYKAIHPSLLIAVGTNRSHLHIPAAKGYPLASWEHFNTTVCSHPLHQFSRRLAAKKGWIVTLTEEDGASYRRKWNAQKVAVIPNPVTVEGLYHEDKEHKCVLAMGRLKSQKGFDRLLRAWQEVHRAYPSWRLRIVGSGSKEQYLKQLCRKLELGESVEMIPHQADVKPYFAQADIFALSSRYEGFVLVLIEALASGLPAVAFDVPRGPREVLESSRCGLVVADGDIKAYASALTKLISDRQLRHELGSNAKARSEDFLPSKILSLWENFIHSSLK